MGGPPLIIYGTLKGWTASTFRATLFSVFFPNCIFLVCGHFVSGFITKTVTWYYLLSLPILLFSLAVGGCLTNRIQVNQFNRIVTVCLLIIGSVLLVRQLT